VPDWHSVCTPWSHWVHQIPARSNWGRCLSLSLSHAFTRAHKSYQAYELPSNTSMIHYIYKVTNIRSDRPILHMLRARHVKQKRGSRYVNVCVLVKAACVLRPCMHALVWSLRRPAGEEAKSCNSSVHGYWKGDKYVSWPHCFLASTYSCSVNFFQ
jgi:hypothetical protein